MSISVKEGVEEREKKNDSKNCDIGRFFANCSGICHCAGGNEGCDQEYGCINYQCAKGWMNPPHCQTPCPQGLYGKNCKEECHCPINDTCSSINGLCTTFKCHPEWTGPGCKNRLPVLKEAAKLVNVSCKSLIVKWLRWDRFSDIGDLNVVAYRLEERINLTDWINVSYIENSSNPEYFFRKEFHNEWGSYQWRVMSIWADNNKYQEGLYSPKTLHFQPKICAEPTETTFASISSSPSSTITTASLSLSTPLSPPSIIKFLNLLVGQKQVFVQWNDVKLAQGYNLSYWKTSTGTCRNKLDDTPTTIVINQSETSYELSKLHKWTVYKLELFAWNSGGRGNSLIKEFLTLEAAPSSKIDLVKYSDKTNSSLTFNWIEPSCTSRGGNITRYDVIVQSQKAAEIRDVSYSLKYEAKNLKSYTEYTFKVRYVNSAGQSNYSDPISTSTLQSPPSQPTNLRILERTISTILISWEKPDEPNGILSAYQLLFWKNVKLKYQIPDIDAKILQYRIEDLEPNSQYTISIKGKTGGGWGREALTRAFTEPKNRKPDGPSMINMVFRNETCIEIRWTELQNENVNNYRITYKPIMSHSGPIDSNTIEKNQKLVKSRICSLLPATQYEFQVRTITDFGSSPPTVALFWTEVPKPLKPSEPIVKNVGKSNVTIILKPVIQNAGPIADYYISVKKVANSSRMRRATTDIPGLIKARLRRVQLLKDIEFLIGDSKFYNNFHNTPLDEGSTYDIYFAVTSQLDGITKSSYSKVEKSVTLGSVTDLPVEKEAKAWETVVPIFLGVFFGLVILGLLIGLIVWRYCVSRRDYGSSLSKSKRQPSWLTLYNKQYMENPKWTTVTDERVDRTISFQDIKIENLKPNDYLLFSDEFHKLPQGQLHPCSAALKKANKRRNRCDHILPYDQNRVILKSDPNDECSDYVNASWVDSYSEKKAFIAAQGPFNSMTIIDFWRLIYQTRARVIVMLTKVEEDGLVKCASYWPTIVGVFESYGKIEVKLNQQETYANYLIRTFVIRKEEGKERKLVHLQFVDWPEHGIPNDPTPFVDFVAKVELETPINNSYPIVVHCGTGVSRTAVFIAVQNLSSRARKEGVINVYQEVKALRHSRSLMVRTLKQYEFIYDVLYELLVCPSPRVAGEDITNTLRQLSSTNPSVKKSYMRQQFEILEHTTPKIVLQHSTARQPDNIEKNRFPTIAPSDRHRVYLRANRPTDSDYINALWMDSYSEKNRFIITQTPLEATLEGFWSMIYDYEVRTIINADNVDLADASCSTYWPSNNNQIVFGNIRVTSFNVTESSYFIARDLLIVNDNQPSPRPRDVRQLHLTSWHGYEKTPEVADVISTVIREIKGSPSPVVIHCVDGTTRSGLICAVSNLLERCERDGEVDVFNTIRCLKRRRPHFVASAEQYRFCYKVLRNAIVPSETDPKLESGYATLDPSNKKTGDVETFYSKQMTREKRLKEAKEEKGRVITVSEDCTKNATRV
ncbi:DgyrCDS7570 [Dimorphilus gyrociliatus]|uniref:protein-tyrosine-phosphatase n=1 Tax=Dimorphilus gyrociliatus TaxID=2664684 RepID=A0A7I8VT44_9ANNE|nr:DgyrCDS7570 [Dimorphilus gyrociliatus]